MRDFSPFLPQLEAYIDGRLDEPATQRLERQLQQDDGLHDYYLSLRLARYYQNPENIPATPGPSPQLLAALGLGRGTDQNGQLAQPAKVVQMPSRPRPWKVAAYSGSAVAAAALVALVIYINPFGPSTGPQLANRSAGTVTYTDGSVTIDGQPAKPGSLWRRGAKLETAAGAFAVVQFADKAAVTVRPNSQVTYTKGLKNSKSSKKLQAKKSGAHKKKPRYHLRMESGYLFAKVKKGSSDFQVRTPTLVAAVRGTEFAVHYKKKKGIIYSQLLVHKGKVSAKMNTANEDLAAILNEDSQTGLNLSEAQRQKLARFQTVKAQPVVLGAGQKVLTKVRQKKLWKLPGMAKFKNKPQVTGKTYLTGSMAKPKKQSKKDRRLLTRLAQIPILPVEKESGRVQLPTSPNADDGLGQDSGPDGGPVFPKAAKIKKLALSKAQPKKKYKAPLSDYDDYNEPEPEPEPEPKGPKSKEERLIELKEQFGALTKITTADGIVYIGGFESQGSKMTVYHLDGKTVILQKNVKSIEAYKE